MAGLTRRLALAASGAALASASVGQARSQPFVGPGRERFSSVVADVSALRSREVGPMADLLQQVLTAELRKEFAGRLGGPAPRLLVRITGVSLNAYAGSGSGGGRWGLGSGTNNDYLEGEALVVGRRGEILARYPQLSAVPASSGGAWYLPDSEQRRVVALAQHFAGWLTRTVP
jgi:hypothetical protein